MNLESISDRYWTALMSWTPTVATVYGVHDFDDQLPRFDAGHLADVSSTFQGLADEAAQLDLPDLQERISQQLLIHQCKVAVRQIGARYMVAPVDPYLGPHTRLLSDTRQNTVTSRSQADALIGRYQKVPEYLEDAMRYHRENASAGLTPAAASVRRVLSQLDGYLESDLASDPFLALKVPGDGDDWRGTASAQVTDVIRPAISTYRDGLKQHILPSARPDDRCGLTWLPGGDEIYSDLIYQYTQLEKPAQEIHDLGQHWVTEINAAEWAEIGEKAFGVSDLESIFHNLGNDPSLRFESEEHMLEHARSALDRAWNVVDDWFATRPETPCDVVPVPAEMAPAMPPAYYMQPPVDGSRPGTYFLNTHKPEERDLFEYESIHFHEGIPGHHFDRSLASELQGIPTFRRYARVFAHTEGWGLYSERLADEMGLYSSEVDRLGMVSADAWRGGRLVTDTGIHALGWSRRQAIEFLQEWTPIGSLTVEQEVDRYIGMPGQALSYKMGQLEILRLRREAESELGERFDIKGFHDTMLVNGAMPLPLLEPAVREWVDSVA